MMFYISKPITDALLAEIDESYNTHLQAIAATSKVKLERLRSIKVGADYAASGLEKPALLLNPLSTDIDDEAVGIVTATMAFEAVFIISGFKEEDGITLAQLYADAFVGMVASDDFLGGEVTHAEVTRIEYYPGGTGTTRYAVLDVNITLEQGRD